MGKVQGTAVEGGARHDKVRAAVLLYAARLLCILVIAGSCSLCVYAVCCLSSGSSQPLNQQLLHHSSQHMIATATKVG
jgi:hypothetical protein